MQFGDWSRFIFALFGLAVLVSSPSSQAPSALGRPSQENRATYADSSDGLQRLLLSMRKLAKSANTDELNALIKDTEIPNYEDWFTTTFGKDKGESWAGPYGRMLSGNESRFQEHMLQLAHQSGHFSVQKLDATKMFDTLNRRLDFFVADWNPSQAGQRTDRIGYFFFIDGKFCWNSTIQSVKVQVVSTNAGASDEVASAAAPAASEAANAVSPARPGVGGVGYPSCLYCPIPEAPENAGDSKKRVTVLLKVIIQTDGRPTNIEVARSGGTAYDEKAIETVRRWRLKPARGAGGAPVAVIQLIEVAFR